MCRAQRGRGQVLIPIPGQREEEANSPTQHPHISLSEARVQTFLFVLLMSILVPSKCAIFLFGWLIKVPGRPLWETLTKTLQFSHKWVMTFMCLLLGFR